MKNPVTRRDKRRHFRLEPLEARVLFSASAPLAAALSQQYTVAPAGFQTSDVTVVSWVGGTTGDWNTPANWSNNAVPTIDDSVSIPSGVTVTISTGAQSVNDLQCDGNLTMTGGSLTLANASTIQGNLSVSNASLTASGMLTLDGTTTIASGAQSIVALQGNGSISMTGGSLTLAADSTLGGNLSVTDATLTVNTGTLHLEGTTTLAGATIAGSGTVSQGFEDMMTISGASSLTGTLSNPGPITIESGGVLTVSGTYTQTTQFSASGMLYGPGSLTIVNGGTFNWDAGFVSGLTGLTTDAGSTVNVPNDVTLDATPWDNYTSLSLPSGFSFTNNAILNHHQGGVLTLSGSNSTISLSGSGTLNNYGSILAGTGNSGTAVTISIGFNSSSTGTIEDESGSLSILGSGTSDAIWTADANGEIVFGGALTMQADTAWNGTGLYSVTGGVTLASGGSLSLVNVQVTGSLGGAGNLTVPSGGVLLVAPGNSNSVNPPTLAGPGSLTIDSGGTLNFGNGPVSDIQLDDPITNNGAIYVNAEYVYFMSGASLTNNNIFEAQTGPTTTNNILTFGSGTAFSEANYNSVITNNGSFQVDSALAGLNIYGQFNNEGTFTIEGSPVQVSNEDGGQPGVSDGVFSVASGASLTFNAAQTFEPGVILNGVGSYEVDSTLTLNGPSIDLSPLNFTLADPGVLAGSGAFTVTKGSTFTFMGSATLEIGGAFTVQAGGVLNFPAGGIATLSGTTITNDGTINFEPGMATSAVDFFQGATLTNEADGTVNLLFAQSQNSGSAAGGLFQDDGTGTINNLGVLVFQGSTAQFASTLLFVSTFNNPGTLEIESGELDLGGTVSQISADQTALTGGTWDVINGSTLVFDSIDLPRTGSGVTVTTNEANVTLSGAGASFNAVSNLSVNSGTIGVVDGATLSSGVGMSGSGGGGPAIEPVNTGFHTNDIVDGPLTNSGTIEVGLGSSLHVTGNYVQTTSGKLIVDVDGTSASGNFGQVTIDGTATLAGTLDVQLQSGFTPTVGDSYSILTYASVAGNFGAFDNVSPQFSASAGAATYTLSVLSTNLPDLVTSNVVGQSSAVAGMNLTVTYTVTNNGTAAAAGSWTDSVYLSPGTNFDPATAVLLGDFQHTGGLVVNGSYNGTVTAVTPSLIPGDYSIIVVADSLEQINDANRANNIGDSAAQQPVSAPKLTLGQPVMSTLANGQEQLYELDLQGNSQVVLTLSTAFAAGAEIYESYNTQPSPASFDQMAFNVTGDTDTLAITGNQPGPYYILVRGREASGTAGAMVTLEAQTSSFGVASASPAAGTNTTTITLTGSQLAANDTVMLVPSTGTGASITASKVYATSNTSLAATFDLTGLAAGTQYDIDVSNGITMSKLLDGFTVGSALKTAAPVAVSITAPQFVRTGEDYTILVNYTNVSGEDQPAPLVTLSATNALLKLSDSVVFASGTIAFVAANNTSGPAGVLPPGYQGSITVEVEQTQNVNHTNINYSYSVADPAQTMDYSALVPYLDSANYTPSQWTAIWNEVQAMLGSTQSGYLQALSQDATLLPAIQGNNTDPIQDFDLTLSQAQAAITTSIEGQITAASPGLSLGGLILIATNNTTHQAYGTYILNDGSFVLPNLDDDGGTYSLSIDGGALLSSSTPITVAAGKQVTGVALSATAGASLLGVVTNAADGSVLAGATINVFGAGGEAYSVVSGANGKYSLSGLPTDTYAIIATSPGDAQSVQEGVAVGTAGMILNLSLSPQATITGSVTPATNSSTGETPLITAQAPGNTDPNLVYSATPDGTGAFTLANLPGGTYDVTISLDGYVSAEFDNVAVAASATQSLGTVNLSATGTINGSVTSTDPDTPAAGLGVGVYQNATLITSTTTDSDGGYSFPGLAPGSYQIEPIAYFYFANDPAVTIAPGQTSTAPVLTLQPGGNISGTVTSSGQALPNLSVFAVDASGTTSVAYVDTNGSYSFSHLAVGSYHVFLGVDGANASTVVSVNSLDNSSTTANLQMTVAASISGQLFLANGTTAVAGGTVTLVENGETVATSTTDASGNYLFLLQQPGTFTIQAAGGGASFNPLTNVTVNMGQALTQENLLAGSGSLNITVTDPSQAIAGSTVGVYEGSNQVAFATLNSSGQVMVPNLVDGDYRIVVLGANSRGVDSSATVSGGATMAVSLTQAQQGTLSGTLMDASTGQPIAGGTVSLYSTSDPNIVYTLPIGANGAYFLSNLAAGAYNVEANAYGYATVIQNNVNVADAANAFNLPLNQDNSTKITGTILDKSGAPVIYALVSILNSDNEILGQTYTDKNGAFVITGVSGTNLTLKVTIGGDTLLNTQEKEFDDNKETDLGEITSAYGASTGIDNAGQKLLSSVVSALKTIGQQLSLVSNPGQLLQPYLDEVNQFGGTPAAHPAPPNCPDCAAAYFALDTAVSFQNIALMDAMTAQKIVQNDAQQLVKVYYKEALTNVTTVLTLSGFALVFFPGVSAYLEANAGAALVTQVTALAQSAASLAGDFLATRDVLKNADLSGDLATPLADNFNQATQNTNDLLGYGAAILTLLKSGPSAFIGNLFGAVGAVQGLLSGGASALSYTDTNAQAATLLQSGRQFMKYRDQFNNSETTLAQKQMAFSNCLAKSSMGCGNQGQGGGSGRKSGGGGSITLTSHDPNDLFGPAGVGTQNFIQATQPLAYRIDFENNANASAPAATVSITETLDQNLDLSTFQLGEFGFGGLTFDVPSGLTSYETTINDVAATGLDVSVSASLDVQTRTVTWTFTSIDPQTDRPPSNPLSGFLPPDVNAPEGLGFVTYTAQAKSGLATGTPISAQASVVFDTNAAIATPTFSNTIDAVAPTSTLEVLPAHESPDFTLQWSGSDDAGGSGLASFSVYESVNNGAYQPFLLNTTSTAAVFNGTIGDTYSFYVVATDNAGNVELAPNSPEATTMIGAPQTFTVTSKKAFTFTDAGGNRVTVKLTGPGSVVGTLDAGVANGADLRSLVLSGTTASSALSVTTARNASTEITEILTTGAAESLGSLELGANVTLGDGLDDGTVALNLTGSVKSVSLGEIAAADQIDLDSGLTGTALEKAAPAFSAGTVLGTGVTIDAAGGLGATKFASWGFAGSLEASLGIASLTVAGAFDADVTAASLGKLSAASFADSSITAMSGNIGGVATHGGTIDGVQISAAEGKIGNITAEVAKQSGSIVAIDDATVTAKSIGNITASVAASSQLTAAEAIIDSQFTSTAGNIGTITGSVSGALNSATGIDGTTFSSSESIGNITVKATSTEAAGIVTAISDSTFTATDALGNITATAEGGAKAPSGGSATGITTSDGDVDFSAGTTIGHIDVSAAGAGGSNEALAGSTSAPIDFEGGESIAMITVSAGESKAAGSSAFALSNVTVTAGGAVGAVLIEGKATATQATELNLTAGGRLAGLTIKSSGNVSFGSLADSIVLAGQSVTLQHISDLTKAGIGFITLTGSLLGDSMTSDSTIGAVGSIGAVSIGGEMSEVSLVAGFDASAFGAGSPGKDSFNDNASIASVKIGGQLVNSSIVAGIDPGSDERWGLSTNAAATSAPGLTAKSKIGAVKIGAATLTGTVSTPFPTGATEISNSAIESLQLTSVQIGSLKPLTSFTTPHWIDANGDGTQQADETLIQTL